MLLAHLINQVQDDILHSLRKCSAGIITCVHTAKPRLLASGCVQEESCMQKNMQAAARTNHVEGVVSA